MAYKQLWFFVEGSDDKRFIETVIKPYIADSVDFIRIIEYAQESQETLLRYLHSIVSTPDSDYILLTDINSSPCVTKKKEVIQKKFKNKLSCNKIAVVIKEIESWYLAGLDNVKCKTFKIKSFNHTNNITKEHFNTLKPQKYDSDNDFMIEILKSYSVDTAKVKNVSFNYFVTKTLASCG